VSMSLSRRIFGGALLAGTGALAVQRMRSVGRVTDRRKPQSRAAILHEASYTGLQQHFHQVTLMLEGDNAGRRASAMIAARLVPKVAVRVVEIPLGSQPDQLGADQIHCLCKPGLF
jgi:hypothetical protein